MVVTELFDKRIPFLLVFKTTQEANPKSVRVGEELAVHEAGSLAVPAINP